MPPTGKLPYLRDADHALVLGNNLGGCHAKARSELIIPAVCIFQPCVVVSSLQWLTVTAPAPVRLGLVRGRNPFYDLSGCWFGGANSVNGPSGRCFGGEKVKVGGCEFGGWTR
jgi:hypothetical protein